MNLKYAILASAMLTSALTMAQKNELKTLAKIYDKESLTSKDIDGYKSALASAEPQMSAASEADKVYFNYYKSVAPMLPLALPENQADPMKVMKTWGTSVMINMAKASAAVVEYEKTSGKKVLTDDIKDMVAMFKPQMINYAVSLGNSQKNQEAASVLYAAYQLDPSDVDNLYYAATYAVAAKDYDNALMHYDELKKLNYSGDSVIYYATSLASDQEESFGTKAERDRMISLKTHKNARDEKQPSKRGEIYKNMVLILIQQNKTNEAKGIIAAARKENPNDTSLMMAEADLYLQLNDFEAYKSIATEVLKQNPQDANLIFNLGVISMQAEQNAEAEKYFKKVIEIDPEFVNAYINLSGLIMRGDKKLVDEMNGLGTSAADNKRYDELKKRRTAMFGTALPYLEKAYAIDPANELVTDNLLSVYGVLEQTEKYKALKAKRK